MVEVWHWWETTLTDWTMLGLYFIGTPAQMLFVLLFFTRKWNKYKFSRAIMWKSAALATLMYGSVCKIGVAGLRNYDWPWWIDLQTPFINTFVMVAIVNQLWALIVDIRVGDRDSMETEVQQKAAEE